MYSIHTKPLKRSICIFTVQASAKYVLAVCDVSLFSVFIVVSFVQKQKNSWSGILVMGDQQPGKRDKGLPSALLCALLWFSLGSLQQGLHTGSVRRR